MTRPGPITIRMPIVLTVIGEIAPDMAAGLNAAFAPRAADGLIQSPMGEPTGSGHLGRAYAAPSRQQLRLLFCRAGELGAT